MTKYLKTAWIWLVYSSANPEKFSMSLKAGATALITYGTVAAGFAHVTLPFELLTQLFDTLIAGVQALLLLISLIVTAQGVWRKIASTVRGTNQVLNSQ